MSLYKRYSILLLLLLPLNVYSQSLDIRILRSLNSPSALPSDSFFQFVSNTDAYVVIGVPSSVLAIALVKKDKELLRDSFVIVAASAFNAGLTVAMKYSIGRDRPFITYSDITKKSNAGSPSFPSGHTSSAFSTATSLSLVYPKWFVIAPAYAWAGTIGYSRMHLGVHYPSDVLIGAVVGAGSAWITHVVNNKLNKR
jgi:membrane-associated phospholipid phosphatase